MAEHTAQASKQPIVVGADRDVAVGAANRLIRRVHPVSGSQRRRSSWSREILGGLPHRQRDARLRPASVDVLADAGRVAMMQRREDAGRGEQRRAKIGQRDAGLHRRAARLARHRHDAGDALRDQIEAALRADSGPVWP